MKSLLTFTAILEGLTGLALMFTPSFVSDVLLGQALKESSGIIIAMVAGAALLALASACWFLRAQESAGGMIKGLLFYNAAIVGIFVFGILSLGLKSIPFGLVACAHAGCAAWCVLVLKKLRDNK